MPKRFDQLDTKAVINDNDRIVILDSEDLIGGNPSVKTADVDAFKGDKGDQGDAGDLVATEGTPVNFAAEVKNAYTTNLTGENNDIVYTSKLDHDDDITITYLDPERESQTLEVVVTGTAIEVYLATNDQNGGEITSTADEIKAAIALVPAAHALVGTADKAGNDGSGVVTALTAATLVGGSAEVPATVGAKGTVRFDGSNVYVAVSANTWKKASLGTL